MIFNLFQSSLLRQIRNRYSFLLERGYRKDDSDIVRSIGWNRFNQVYRKGSMIIIIGDDFRERQVVPIIAHEKDAEISVDDIFSFSEYLKSIDIPCPGRYDGFRYNSLWEVSTLIKKGARLLEQHLEGFEAFRGIQS